VVVEEGSEDNWQMGNADAEAAASAPRPQGQNTNPKFGSGAKRRPTKTKNEYGSLNKGKRKTNHMLIAAPYSLSAHERGQLGPVDYLAGPGDVWESRLKADGTRVVRRELFTNTHVPFIATARATPET